MSNNIGTEMSFENRMIKIGIITVSCAIVANFVPALYMWIAYGVVPNVGTLFKIWGLLAATFGVGWIVQPVTYFPAMGVTGTYIGWTAGNVADLRGPCSRMAQKVAGVEPGTTQGEVMSTIGVTCSIFISIAVITVFTFIGANILPMLPKAVSSSFTYILPAVFGAVYADLCAKSLDVGLGTIVLAVIIVYFGTMLKVNTGYQTILVIAAAMMVSRVSYLKIKKKANKNEAA